MNLPKLKLFAIRNIADGKIIPGTFFHAKQDAKAERAKLGNDTHVVTSGPDHRKFRTV